MALFKTLEELKKKVEKPAFDGERIPRFFIIKPGEEYRIRFRQELTQDLSGYDEEAGLAEHVMVHSNPLDFTKQARCTHDLEEFGSNCWACQQIPKDRGWKAKGHLLVNVAVYNADEDKWEPRVLDQKFTAAHVAEQLLELASEYSTITDRDYKIKRKGTKQDTQYTLVPLAAKDADASIAELPYHDLSSIYKIMTESEQEAYFLTEADGGSSSNWD